ncbi:hypothetical protein ES703_71777 [subsurface metagenome]
MENGFIIKISQKGEYGIAVIANFPISKKMLESI